MNVTLVVPGRLATRTGGYIYDRRIVEGLRARGWSTAVAELDDSFPNPTTPALRDAAQRFGEIPSGSIVLVDSLALGPLADVLPQHADRLRLVALMHLPLSETPGVSASNAAQFQAAERRALASVAKVVVTGAATVPMVKALGVHEEDVIVVEPGTDRVAAPAGTRRAGKIVRLLCVATITAGKGHDVLVRALARMPLGNWRLTCAGSLTRDPRTVTRLRELVDQHGLGARVVLAGDLDRDALDREYAKADVFVLASQRETYGMAVAEAIAHGLPVVSTSAGAIQQIAHGCGLFVDAGHCDGLSATLTRVITDASLRARLAEHARAAANRLPTWDDATDKMAGVLEEVVRG